MSANAECRERIVGYWNCKCAACVQRQADNTLAAPDPVGREDALTRLREIECDLGYLLGRAARKPDEAQPLALEVRAKMQAAIRALTSAPAVGDCWTDAEIIALCNAAGVRWIEPDCGDDDEYCFPGGFDMSSMGEMRVLFASFAAAPVASPVGGDAFLRHCISVMRGVFDLCEPKPQRTPEDDREHNGGLALSELAICADQLEAALSTVAEPLAGDALRTMAADTGPLTVAALVASELADAAPVAGDEAMALHWIDRYASGIDAAPQLDRIRDALCPAASPAAAEAVAHPSEGDASFWGLWDSQWVNIVNHDNCYREYTKDEAVAKAVKLTYAALRENNTAPTTGQGQSAKACPREGCKLAGPFPCADETCPKRQSAQGVA